MRMALQPIGAIGHQVEIMSALAAGMRACGDSVEFFDSRTQPKRTHFDGIAIWGWRRARQYHQQGWRVLVVERAYMLDRFSWYSLGWDGLNGRAMFPRPEDSGARWGRHFAHLMQPWRERDGYALIMGQVVHDQAVRGINFSAWAERTAQALRRSGLVARFRPHPNMPRASCRSAPLLEGTLGDALAGAAVVVTYNSNSAVDAVLAGVPAVSMDPGSMAYAVTSHDIARPIVRPDRAAWAHRMAYTQWRPEELSTGEAWSHLRSLVT